MATRTIRLNDAEEAELALLMKARGWTASKVLKEGLQALATKEAQAGRDARDIYAEIMADRPATKVRPGASRAADHSRLLKESLKRRHEKERDDHRRHGASRRAVRST